jgi:hypothetical protein
MEWSRKEQAFSLLAGRVTLTLVLSLEGRENQNHLPH